MTLRVILQILLAHLYCSNNMSYVFNPLSGNLESSTIPNNSITTAKLASPIAPVVSSINGGQIAGTRNRIINGSMRVNQRVAPKIMQADFAVEDSGFIVDRWSNSRSNSGGNTAGLNLSSQQSANLVEFKRCVRIVVTSEVEPQNIAANHIYQLYQTIEGVNVLDFNFGTSSAQPITISFWVASNVTGKHSFAIVRSDLGYSYVTSYTITQANQFEYKTITIPGAGAGTGVTEWSTLNAWGSVIWDLGSGSSYNTTTPNVWQTGHFRRTSDSVHLVSDTNNYLSLTGVQLEVGTQATPFEHRSYSEDLLLCQRYYMPFSYEGGAHSYPDASSVFVSIPGLDYIRTSSPSISINAPGYITWFNGTNWVTDSQFGSSWYVSTEIYKPFTSTPLVFSNGYIQRVPYLRISGISGLVNVPASISINGAFSAEI